MSHDPQSIAVWQLQTALRLYFEQEEHFDRGGYYSVITLAGAAEEILGKLLKENGIENSLDSLKKAAVLITKQLFGEASTENAIGARANDARNKLKHWSPDKPIEFDAREEAEAMLDRAISNYDLLTSCEPSDTIGDAIQRFRDMHAYDNKQIRP